MMGGGGNLICRLHGGQLWQLGGVGRARNSVPMSEKGATVLQLRIQSVSFCLWTKLASK